MTYVRTLVLLPFAFALFHCMHAATAYATLPASTCNLYRCLMDFVYLLSFPLSI
eukprot:m.1686040 g.1686040  ORF g.1686040 m.1686040 type:complete len:54 (+) comp260264_c0_seq1:39-200(+)